MKTKNLLLISLVLFSFSCKKDTPTKPYPKEGLISYFNFDDNLKDQSGNTNDGIGTGNPVFVLGKRSKAISFNGINQSVNFVKKQFEPSTQLSVALWFKTNDSFNSYFFGGNKFVSFFGLFIESAGNIGLAIDLQGGGTNNAKASFNSNQWTHFVGTYDGTDIKVYIDGVLKATTNSPGIIKGYVEEFTLGAINGQNYWNGDVDDLFIYHKALTQAEVTQLYNLK